jgi:hypothetical protein
LLLGAAWALAGGEAFEERVGDELLVGAVLVCLVVGAGAGESAGGDVCFVVVGPGVEGSVEAAVPVVGGVVGVFADAFVESGDVEGSAGEGVAEFSDGGQGDGDGDGGGRGIGISVGGGDAGGGAVRGGGGEESVGAPPGLGSPPGDGGSCAGVGDGAGVGGGGVLPAGAAAGRGSGEDCFVFAWVLVVGVAAELGVPGVDGGVGVGELLSGVAVDVGVAMVRVWGRWLWGS